MALLKSRNTYMSIKWSQFIGSPTQLPIPSIRSKSNPTSPHTSTIHPSKPLIQPTPCGSQTSTTRLAEPSPLIYSDETLKSRSFHSLTENQNKDLLLPSSLCLFRSVDQMLQDQATSSLAASSLPSSSERSSSSAFQLEVKEGMESDEEIGRVPEIGGGESAGASVSGRKAGSVAGPDRVQGAGENQRKRGRNPADKESKRLKRLLRNRVSAQQARERKKAYLSDLEVRVKDLEQKNSELEERLSTLQNENQMLRHVCIIILLSLLNIHHNHHCRWKSAFSLIALDNVSDTDDFRNLVLNHQRKGLHRGVYRGRIIDCDEHIR